MVPVTVSSILVVGMILTVTCPDLVVSVKVLPSMAVIVPSASGRRAVVVVDVVVGTSVVSVVAVVVVVVVDDVVAGDDDEQATVTKDRTTDSVSPAPKSIIFLRFIFIDYPPLF
jgi:hypothetical protein